MEYTAEQSHLVAVYGICWECGAPRDVVKSVTTQGADDRLVEMSLTLRCTADPGHEQ